MASLSRGFPLPCLQCRWLPFLPPRATPITSRFFSSSPFQHRAATSAVAAPLAPSRYGLIKNLASKPTPTLLYEAPSHFWFYFGCWTSGLSVVVWTVATGPWVVDQPAGVPRWVRGVFTISYGILGLIGMCLLSKTVNIVGTIRLLPSAYSPVGVTAKASMANRQAIGATAGAVAASQPRLEVTMKRMLPLLHPKVIVVDLGKVRLKSRFSLPQEYVPELKRLEQEREEEKREAQLYKQDMENILTLPFRHLSCVLVKLFQGVRSAWTDMGWGTIRVDDKQYKVDIMNGFSHEGFRTLERIVDVGW